MERNFGYEQSQSRRWLNAKVHGTRGENTIGPCQRELATYFKCYILEERDAQPELTPQSRAIVETLEAERERGRVVQGGVANPKDWFIHPTEERELEILMKGSSLNDKGNAEAADPSKPGEDQSSAKYQAEDAAARQERLHRRQANRIKRIEKEISDAGDALASPSVQKTVIMKSMQRTLKRREDKMGLTKREEFRVKDGKIGETLQRRTRRARKREQRKAEWKELAKKPQAGELSAQARDSSTAMDVDCKALEDMVL